MPLILTEVANGRAWICDYVRWSAANPAKIWGLHPRKGTLQPGADADIAIVDLEREWTIDDARLQSRAKISPWHGRSVKGLPIHTLVRGRFAMRDRRLCAEARGWGRSVHAIQCMPPAVCAMPTTPCKPSLPAAVQSDNADRSPWIWSHLRAPHF
jgi:dihydroorotase